MMKELIEEFKKEPFLKETIKEAIEKKVGRKIDTPGKETIVFTWVEREDNNIDGYVVRFGAISFEGDIYGFLEVDYRAEKLRFIPSSLLLPI